MTVRDPSLLHLTGDMLMHLDLNLTPEAIHGKSHESTPCPVRDLSLVAFWTNAISVKWAIFLAQHCRVSARGLLPENDPMVLHFKQEAYRTMTAELANLDYEAPSDDTLFGVLVAGIFEHRLGNKRIAKKHLEASFVIWSIQQRHRSKRWIAFPAGLPMCIGYIGIGLENFYRNLAALQLAQRQVLDILGQMERWNHLIRCVTLARFGESQVMPQSDSGRKHNLSEQYLRLRSAAFGRSGIVRYHLSALMQEKTEYGTRLCLGALYAVNEILYALRDDESSAASFILRLTIKLRNADGSDHVPNLTSTAIVYGIASCAREVKHLSDQYESCFTPWPWVKFVDLMMLASSDSQRKMCETLAKWLFANMARPEELNLGSEWRRERIREETKIKWLEQQSATLTDLEGHSPSSEDRTLRNDFAYKEAGRLG